MEVVEIIINIALLLSSVILVVVVLLQKSSGSGLGSAFGGESPSAMGRSKTATREAKLQRATVALGVILAVLAIALMLLPVFDKKTDETADPAVSSTPIATVAPEITVAPVETDNGENQS